MIKVAARRVVTIARPSRRSRRRTWKRCSPRSKTSGRSLTLGIAGMGVTTERLRPFRAHNGMTATARTPVLPEATPVGALSAQSRCPLSRPAGAAYVDSGRIRTSRLRKERAFVDGLANVPNATLSAHSCSVRVRKAFANCGHWLAQWQFTGIGSKRSSDRISRKFLADATTVKMDKFNFSPDNSTLTLTAPSMSI
jgi:hypothetical protein